MHASIQFVKNARLKAQSFFASLMLQKNPPQKFKQTSNKENRGEKKHSLFMPCVQILSL